ncbi:MAG: asparagine synthase-related protein [Achromobacter sp.]|uniref:asparagine synthase-related protein n=1 Tax=Achromobacter sp. TaxID=134375 RepID=UPI003D03E1DC
MLLIHAQHLTQRVRHVIDAHGNNSHLAIQSDDWLTIMYTRAWAEFISGDLRVLYRAPTYVMNEIVRRRDDFLSDHWLRVAHKLAGPYLIARCRRGEVEVARSLYRGQDLFYSTIDSTIAFSTKPSWLLRLTDSGTHEIDGEYCRRFIVDTPEFSNATPLQRVKSISLGQAVHSDLRALTPLPAHVPVPNGEDVVPLLSERLACITKQFERTSLSFSGGLDSSALLYCLTKAGTNFVATHALSSLPYADTELAEATRIAKSLRAEIQIQRMNEDSPSPFQPHLFKTPVFSSPFDVDIFSPAPPAENLAVLGTAEIPRELILTGHGGDHVFLQNPGRNVAFDPLLKLNIVGAFSEVRRYCRLKKDNIYAAMVSNLKLLFRGKNHLAALLHTPTWLPSASTSKSRPEHHLLSGLDPRTAKHAHVRAILLALHTISPPRAEGATVLHPLLLPEVIGTVLHRPVSELYSSEHDRVVLRNSVFRASRHDFSWRRSKRSSSAGLFKYFQDNQEILHQWLSAGILVRALGIDTEQLRKSISVNGQAYLNEDFPALINIIQLELFLQSMLTQPAAG